MRLLALLVPLLVGAAPAPLRPEVAPTERPAASRIVKATVFPNQALVRREVAVPEGAGPLELVVGPLPEQVVTASLAAEGTDGVRVLGARYRTRVETSGEAEVERRQALLRQNGLDVETLQAQIAVGTEDQRLLRELTDLSGRTTRNLAEVGRFEDLAAINLAQFVMTTRAERSRTETELRQRVRGLTEAGDLARRELADLKAKATRTVYEAVLTVQKDRAEATPIRLEYLVRGVAWAPQYRIRVGADDKPVRLESLAAIRQTSGEDWSSVRLTLATTRPGADAAPPDLVPLRMATADAAEAGSPARVHETHDARSEQIRAVLDRVIPLRFPQDTPLSEVVRYIQQATQGPGFPNGVPIYVDRNGLANADRTEASPVSIDLTDVPLRVSLRLVLNQLTLVYAIQDGVLTITDWEAVHGTDPNDDGPDQFAGMAGMGGGMGGMGGGAIEQADVGAALNRAAAADQARELRVAEQGARRDAGDDAGGGDPAQPSVPPREVGLVDLPSRPDPLLIEVGAAALPAEFFAQATPVLTPQVYRMARLTNASGLALLPGEATLYREEFVTGRMGRLPGNVQESVDEVFVGRMTLPLVAAGESFVVGLGVDPQLQVSRRLASKTRTIQGGNQILTYAFRLNVRNYRDRPVRVRLQDRLPLPEGEAVAVHLGKTSRDLSADPLYQRTGRADNLLRWDLDVPANTVGDAPLSVEYDFRIESAKDLPLPRFQAGGLHEGPIGGPASQRGTGGFRSVPSGRPERSGPP